MVKILRWLLRSVQVAQLNNLGFSHSGHPIVLQKPPALLYVLAVLSQTPAVSPKCHPPTHTPSPHNSAWQRLLILQGHKNYLLLPHRHLVISSSVLPRPSVKAPSSSKHIYRAPVFPRALLMVTHLILIKPWEVIIFLIPVTKEAPPKPRRLSVPCPRSLS